MKERPINMRAEEVRAILAGRKTQFRRVFKFVETNQPPACPDKFNPKAVTQPCPFGQPGDRLWVRETWTDISGMGFDSHLFPSKALQRVAYRADCSSTGSLRLAKEYGVVWSPSVHMPRKFSRITLEVVSVRLQRIQDISEEDAEAEGYNSQSIMENPDAGRLWFRDNWQSINGPEDWDENPWVWVVEFKVIEGGAE